MKKIILSCLLASLSVSQSLAQQVAPFKAGDRVAFVGNSITDGGHYHSYIWLYYMTHFPEERLWMANCGIGGDTAENILKRLDGDVFAKRPTVITLTFGMNDSGYFEYNGDNAEDFGNKQVAKSRENFLEIEKRLKGASDIRKIMIGTSPYDQTSTFNDNIFKNKNDYMQKIVAFQDSAAKANRWEMVDFNRPMTEVNLREQAKDPKFTLIGNDRVHPDNDGHMYMAYLFLKAQGMDGKPVAEVTIDGKGRVTGEENCKVTNVRRQNGVTTFDYLAESLPYPLDTIAHGWGFKRPQADIVKFCPEFIEEMNREQLTVKGLKGQYRLLIDEVLIDTLSAVQLQEGVNLATYRHTPQYQQACKVMALNEERWETERRFRDYAWLQYNFFMPRGLLDVNDEHAAEVFREGQKKDGWVAARRELYDKMIHQEVREAYQDEMKLLVDRIYQVNKPQTRHIRIEKIK
ncbi:MAG: SGNH/GDSL hydrolase family protein [Prevotella sp.]|nr:SGNH/GDSL hydrolase family protein [Prevotella sp.]